MKDLFKFFFYVVLGSIVIIFCAGVMSKIHTAIINSSSYNESATKEVSEILTRIETDTSLLDKVYIKIDDVDSVKTLAQLQNWKKCTYIRLFAKIDSTSFFFEADYPKLKWAGLKKFRAGESAPGIKKGYVDYRFLFKTDSAKNSETIEALKDLSLSIQKL